MGAPKDNEFWKKRSKHGRDRIFATPEIMLEAAYEYFEWKSNQQWIKTDYKGKDVIPVEIPTSSPFSMTGLCIFLGVNTSYFAEFKRGLSNLDENERKDFSAVISEIEDIIYNQKFEGAVVGAYNANIIARDLGLAESTVVKQTTTVKPSPDMSPQEAARAYQELMDDN